MNNAKRDTTINPAGGAGGGLNVHTSSVQVF